MTRETLKLPIRPMTSEEWDRNVDCRKAKRAHKWIWKIDISSGMPSMDQAVCAHCGVETTLNRQEEPNVPPP